MHDISLLKA